MSFGDIFMKKNEKQYGYSRKLDKGNMWTLAARVRTDAAEDLKKYCGEKVTSRTSEVKRLIEAASEERKKHQKNNFAW